MTTIDKRVAGAVTWVDLMTDDLAAARKFYGRLFDWSFEEGPPESGGYTMCLRGGQRVAGMMAKAPDAPQPTAWDVYFATDDLDKTLVDVREHGGQVVMGPMDVMEEGRMAMAAEPTGGHFGLWQPKRHTGLRLIDEPGAYAWTELNTRDLLRARDFLCRVFGYQARKLEGQMEYTTLHLGEQTIGGILQMNDQWPAQVPPHWMVYFAVADADGAGRQAAELGGKVCVPPFDTPYGRISVLEDPQGGTFSVVKMPAKG